MQKNYKYLLGYLYENHKVKPLHIMLPKKTAMKKVTMHKLNGFSF